MANLELTSVKIEAEIKEEFQINAIKNKFNLQKLVNRCVDMYNKDEEFRTKIHNYINLKLVDKKL